MLKHPMLTYRAIDTAHVKCYLNWNDQVEYIHKKVYQCIYKFIRLCFKPPLEIRKLLISTLVFPLFDYASLAYCDLNDQLITKIQRAQNACVRYIFNLKLDDHVTRYYYQLWWLKIRERIILVYYVAILTN